MSDVTGARSPLRILHTESSTGWGGQEIRILTEARGMLDRGHEVMLVTPPDADIYPAARKMGIPVVALPIGKKRVGAALALRRWLAQHGPAYTVINTHSSTDSWLTAFARATLPGLAPTVRTRHVSTPLNQRAATRWLYLRSTAHIVTAGEALRRQLHRDNGFPLEHMTSIPTGIDLTLFRPLPRVKARARLNLPDLPTLGILATLRDWKGHDYLLEALTQLRGRFPDWRLLIIGDGPRRGHLEREVARLGLSEIVRFVGNQDDVPEWLSALDLFVLPSYGDEGVPQAIMQAMACGLAVVSTPIGAIAEAVVDGTTGVLVPPRDAAGLAAGLARLMADPAERSAMGNAGRQRALERFGIEIMLDRMEAIFRQFGRAA